MASRRRRSARSPSSPAGSASAEPCRRAERAPGPRRRARRPPRRPARSDAAGPRPSASSSGARRPPPAGSSAASPACALDPPGARSAARAGRTGANRPGPRLRAAADPWSRSRRSPDRPRARSIGLVSSSIASPALTSRLARRAPGARPARRAVQLVAAHAVRDRVEHAVHEGGRGLVAEAARQLDRFVEDHRGRRIAVLELVDGESHDVAVHRRHAREPPVLRVLRDPRVERHRGARSRPRPARLAKARAPSGRSKFAATSSKLSCSACAAPERVRPTRRRRRAPAAPPGATGAGRRARASSRPPRARRAAASRGAEGGRRRRGESRAISIAASAASAPLLPSDPARARSAWSTSSTVEHAEGDRHAGVAHHLAHAVGDAAAHVLEVRRAAADHDAERRDRVVAAALREHARRVRDLEGAGHPGDVDVARAARRARAARSWQPSRSRTDTRWLKRETTMAMRRSRASVELSRSSSRRSPARAPRT